MRVEPPAAAGVADTAAAIGEMTATLAARAAGARALSTAIATAQLAAALDAQRAVADLTARLPHVQRRATADPRALTADIVAGIRTLMSEIKVADNAVASALADAGTPNLPLWFLAQGHSTTAALDALFEAPWNIDNDLLVLVGDGAWAIGVQAAKRGHTRVLVVDATAPETTIAPEGTEPSLWNAHTVETLRNVCGFMAWPLPAQARVVQAGPVIGALCPNAHTTLTAAALRPLLAEILTFVGFHQLQLMEQSQFFVLKASRNLAAVAKTPSIACLGGVLAGWTAVVVSAGPSLDKNLHLLAGLQDRVVIIGINQTVASLRRVGVRADLIVTVDPLNVSYHFEGARPGDIGSLFLGTSVDPSLFATPSDRVVTFSSSPVIEHWIYDFLGENAAVGSGGTVSTAALRVAAWLGCTTIISIGRDLALVGNQYYASSSADGGQDVARTDDGQQISFGSYSRKLRLADGGGDREAIQKLLDSQVYALQQVPGFFGAPVTTTDLFLQELEMLHRAIEAMTKEAPIRFINATEGGVFVQGMEHMTLAAATAHCRDLRGDPNQLIAARLAEAADTTRAVRMGTALETLSGDLARLVSLCREASALADQDGPKAERRRQRATQEIADLCRSRAFLSVLVQQATRAIVKKGAATYESLAAVAKAERALYAAVGELASSLHPQVAAAASQLSRWP